MYESMKKQKRWILSLRIFNDRIIHWITLDWKSESKKVKTRWKLENSTMCVWLQPDCLWENADLIGVF